MKNSAPADEYFGRMKLSFLGINNTFRDQSVRAGDHTIDSTVIGKADAAADALRDWERKYPRDPQLARSLFLGSLAYLKIWTVSGQQKAAAYLLELRNKFASTFFGKRARSSLQKGLTMHVVEAALPCTLMPNSVVPTPGPVPTANASYNIKVSTIPAPCYQVTPAPTASAPVPSASPTPSPSGLQRPGQTPSPLPSASASPMPSASASAAPSPSASPSPVPSPSPTPRASSGPTPRPSPAPTPNPTPS
ncbi:MAG TPA: hypothetical protein VGQ96_07320 [Candidatus Eremiobacteraceae bacterium]|nr:hypothetical protein [Candidatus Eremiobacteraceae bacterium]